MTEANLITEKFMIHYDLFKLQHLREPGLFEQMVIYQDVVIKLNADFEKKGKQTSGNIYF